MFTSLGCSSALDGKFSERPQTRDVSQQPVALYSFHVLVSHSRADYTKWFKIPDYNF